MSEGSSSSSSAAAAAAAAAAGGGGGNGVASDVVSLRDLAASHDHQLAEARVQEARGAKLFGEEGRCTFDDGAKRQGVFACLSCRGKDGPAFGVCYGCAMACHLECEGVVELWPRRAFRCDCGTPASRASSGGGKPCTFVAEALQTLARPSNNAANRYGQNFEGKFCVCSGGYDPLSPDPGQVMRQCVTCEDWFHDACMLARGGQQPPASGEGRFDLLCPACTRAMWQPFLRAYPALLRPSDSDAGSTDAETAGSSTAAAAPPAAAPPPPNLFHVEEHQQFWLMQTDDSAMVDALRGMGPTTDRDDVPYIDYSRDGDTLIMGHTFTPTSLRGRGMAEALGRGSLRWVLQHNASHKGQPPLRAALTCSYLAHKFGADPEFATIVAGGSSATGSSTTKSKTTTPTPPLTRPESCPVAVSAEAGAVGASTDRDQLYTAEGGPPSWWVKGWRRALCVCAACQERYRELGVSGFLVSAPSERPSDGEEEREGAGAGAGAGAPAASSSDDDDSSDAEDEEEEAEASIAAVGGADALFGASMARVAGSAGPGAAVNVRAAMDQFKDAFLAFTQGLATDNDASGDAQPLTITAEHVQQFLAQTGMRRRNHDQLDGDDHGDNDDDAAPGGDDDSAPTKRARGPGE